MIISFVSIYFNSCVMQLMQACCQVFMHIGAFNVASAFSVLFH